MEFCARYNKRDQKTSFYSHAKSLFQLSQSPQEKIGKIAHPKEHREKHSGIRQAPLVRSEHLFQAASTGGTRHSPAPALIFLLTLHTPRIKEHGIEKPSVSAFGTLQRKVRSTLVRNHHQITSQHGLSCPNTDGPNTTEVWYTWSWVCAGPM